MIMEHKYKLLLIALALAVSLPSAGFGATYYVSPTGSAGNPGTEVSPWSLAKANSDLTAGDTAILLNGSYSTQIAPSNSGTSGNPITYEAQNSRMALLTSGNPRILINNRSYITIDGIKSSHPNVRWLHGNSSSHITINDCEFTGASGGSFETGRFQSSGGYVTITNSTLDEQSDGIHIRESVGHYIANNQILDDAHSPLVFMGVEDSIIENNYFNNQVHRNVEILSIREVYDPEDITQFILIQDNYFTFDDLQDKSSSIKMNGCNSILRRNIWDDCPDGAALLMPNSYGSQESYRPEGWFSEHNRVYNNTFYNCNEAIGISKSDTTIAAGGAFGDHIFINNIIYNGVTAKQITIYTDADPYEAEFYYNSIMRTTTGQDVFFWEDRPGPDNYLTIAEIENDHGTHYANNEEYDPDFVDADSDDFELLSTSNCIDAGGALTLTNGSGTGTVITVDDALFFTDGYGLITGDEVYIGTDVVTITDVDYANNELTVDGTITWADNEDVGLSYLGSAPDMGAFEYDPGAGNAAPSVSAGSDDECTLPDGVTLDGTVTDDGLPDPPAAFTVAWSKISGTGTVSFGDSTAIDTTATFSVADTYVLRLFADDDDLTDYDDVTIIVNAAGSGPLMSDNFNDNNISDWTVVSGTGWSAFGGQATKIADDSVDAAIEKGGFSVSSGTITLEFDLTVSGDWRPGNAGLVDASGNGVYLHAYIGDTYITIGAQNTDDNALTGTGGGSTDATADPTNGITFKYEVNLDTGEVKGYLDDSLKHTETLSLSGVGAITDVVFQARKQWYLDNVVLNGPGGSGNTAPTADAGSDDECTLPSGVTLDGTVGDDGLPDPPGAVTTTWSKSTGPGDVTFGDSSAVDTTATFSAAGTYVLQLEADDGDLTDTDTVQIVVNADPNTAPSVSAGSDDECTLPSGVTLDGTVSDDGLPDPPASVTTTWSKTSGSGTVSFGDSSAVDTTATFSVADTYVLRLTADDNDLTNYDEVTIVVNAEPAPDTAFQESGGTVVMECENYDDNDTSSDGSPWENDTSYGGYVGTGHMTAPSSGGSKSWSTGAALTYDIDFTTAGTYYIWVRRYADRAQENEAFVGLDGTQIGDVFDDYNGSYDQWYWQEHGTAVYISSGSHQFNLRRREKQYGVDRIILTDDSGYTPSGNGPAESSRQ